MRTVRVRIPPPPPILHGNGAARSVGMMLTQSRPALKSSSLIGCQSVVGGRCK